VPNFDPFVIFAEVEDILDKHFERLNMFLLIFVEIFFKIKQFIIDIFFNKQLPLQNSATYSSIAELILNLDSEVSIILYNRDVLISLKSFL
jgi:hypothetical protein